MHKRIYHLLGFGNVDLSKIDYVSDIIYMSKSIKEESAWIRIRFSSGSEEFLNCWNLPDGCSLDEVHNNFIQAWKEK